MISSTSIAIRPAQQSYGLQALEQELRTKMYSW